MFTKTLASYPKGPGEANSNARIIVARAIDVDGTPFVNERVCFNVGNLADGAFPYFGTLAPGITIGGSEAPLKGNADSCSYTDANGRAAVEVLNSDPEVINVIADFDPEGLLRSIDADFPGPPAVVIPKDPPTKTEISDDHGSDGCGSRRQGRQGHHGQPVHLHRPARQEGRQGLARGEGQGRQVAG